MRSTRQCKAASLLHPTLSRRHRRVIAYLTTLEKTYILHPTNRLCNSANFIFSLAAKLWKTSLLVVKKYSFERVMTTQRPPRKFHQCFNQAVDRSKLSTRICTNKRYSTNSATTFKSQKAFVHAALE